MRVRSTFFSERVVNVWNNVLASVDFKSLSSFKRTVKLVDLSKSFQSVLRHFYVLEPYRMFDAFVCFICCICVTCVLIFVLCLLKLHCCINCMDYRPGISAVRSLFVP